MAPTPEPEVGDLIEIFREIFWEIFREIFRGSYQHWAVYVGDGFIVHLAPPSEVPGAGANSAKSLTADRAIVKKEELSDVVGSDEWKINNRLDKQYKPRPARDIVRQACEMVGDELPYGIDTYNCEHFANQLRYGKAESQQVRVVVKASILTIIVVFLLLAIAYQFRCGK